MKQSKSSLTVIGICVALFVIGFYLKFSHQSDKIKIKRQAIAAATQAASNGSDQAPVLEQIENSPGLNEGPSPATGLAPRLSSTPGSTPGFASDQVSAAATASIDRHTPLANFDDQAAFQKVIVEAKASIPSIKHLRGLSDSQLHETPVEIQDAGLALGRVADALEAHPELAKEAIAFYEVCVVNEQYPTSVRTSCYLDLSRQYRKLGRSMESFSGDAQVSRRIKESAKSLM